MSYTKIYLHYVWATKNRFPFINKGLKHKLLDHFKAYAKSQELYIIEVNCMEDHVHVLLSIHLSLNIADVAKLLKGESSYWINKNKFTDSKFQWAKKYYVSSVSEKEINTVIKYIKNQEQHHLFSCLDEELDDL